MSDGWIDPSLWDATTAADTDPWRLTIVHDPDLGTIAAIKLPDGTVHTAADYDGTRRSFLFDPPRSRPFWLA